MGSRIRPGQYFVHGTSSAMRAIERTIVDIASTDIPVLLAGESGTGKEIVAIEIHRLSPRREEPFVKCGCAGMTGDTLAARLGCGQQSLDDSTGTRGSIYLDGINHLEIGAQARLMNLLPDTNGASPEGCNGVRVITSTTRNLEEEMKAGNFREELYYRINGVHLRLPPLRERKEDIPALFEFFLKKYASLFERLEPNISDATRQRLLDHSWPGNIRELENVARKIVALGKEEIAIQDLQAGPVPSPLFFPAGAAVRTDGQGSSIPRSLKDAARQASRQAERSMILAQLERTHWNRKKAARELQISYKALLYKLKQLGLEGNDRPEEP